MRSFLDSKGREWSLELSYPLVKQVRQLCGVDLLETSKATFDKLSDPATLVDVVYILCREQATARKMTDEDFGAAMVGDPLDPATEQLVEAIVDFFPTPRQATLRKLFAEIREVAKLQQAELIRLIDSGELRRRLSPNHSTSDSAEVSAPTPPGIA